MKKLLLSLSMLLALGSAEAQNVYAYGFDGNTAAMLTAGWVQTNQSTAASATRLWTVPAYTAVTVNVSTPPAATDVNPNPFSTTTYANGTTCPAPSGQAGGANSFCLVNYLSTTSSASTGATISNWLISPEIFVQDGDVVSFYTRLGKYSPTNTASFADNLQLRMSTNGAFTANPSTGPTDLGDFTNLLVEINPTLNLTSYPCTWTQYSYTVSGVGTTPTSVKFAFRYYVTDGGANGNNSDIIGIDTFSVDRPSASTTSFFNTNFAATPNPTSGLLKITNTKNIEVNQMEVTDVNGRVVKNIKGMVNELNISELNAGVYFLKITSNQGSLTTKIVKK